MSLLKKLRRQQAAPLNVRRGCCCVACVAAQVVAEMAVVHPAEDLARIR